MMLRQIAITNYVNPFQGMEFGLWPDSDQQDVARMN
jgi:hypothetical protein